MNDRALKAYVFYCSNHLEAGRVAKLSRGYPLDTIKSISLPCSGKIDIPYLMKAFEAGADGVAIVTCPKHECRHFEGNFRAHKRAEGVETLLEEIGAGAGRMAVFECATQTPELVMGEIEEFIERVRNLPPMQPQSSHLQLEKSSIA
jgi:coenzyme F420-reducing hydrogenase delta subunit